MEEPRDGAVRIWDDLEVLVGIISGVSDWEVLVLVLIARHGEKRFGRMRDSGMAIIGWMWFYWFRECYIIKTKNLHIANNVRWELGSWNHVLMHL